MLSSVEIITNNYIYQVSTLFTPALLSLVCAQCKPKNILCGQVVWMLNGIFREMISGWKIIVSRKISGAHGNSRQLEANT